MATADAVTAEAKEEAVIKLAEAAAQDPESKLKPEIAEEVLVEESRKAGAAAFQFDPDASPEAKTAGLEAVWILEYAVYRPANGARLYPPDFALPNKEREWQWYPTRYVLVETVATGIVLALTLRRRTGYQRTRKVRSTLDYQSDRACGRGPNRASRRETSQWKTDGGHALGARSHRVGATI